MDSKGNIYKSPPSSSGQGNAAPSSGGSNGGGGGNPLASKGSPKKSHMGVLSNSSGTMDVTGHGVVKHDYQEIMRKALEGQQFGSDVVHGTSYAEKRHAVTGTASAKNPGTIGGPGDADEARKKLSKSNIATATSSMASGRAPGSQTTDNRNKLTSDNYLKAYMMKKAQEEAAAQSKANSERAQQQLLQQRRDMEMRARAKDLQGQIAFWKRQLDYDTSIHPEHDMRIRSVMNQLQMQLNGIPARLW